MTENPSQAREREREERTETKTCTSGLGDSGQEQGQFWKERKEYRRM
jgi:hypothetical protein